METAHRQLESTSFGHRLLEDAEYSKTLLVVLTTVGCVVLLGFALFANFALR